MACRDHRRSYVNSNNSRWISVVGAVGQTARLRKLQLARSSKFGHQEHTFTTSYNILDNYDSCCSPFHPIFVKCWFFAQSMSKILKDAPGRRPMGVLQQSHGGSQMLREFGREPTRSRAAEAAEGANSKYLKP